MRWPAKVTVPPEGSISPSTQRPIVVLPDPEFTDKREGLSFLERQADVIDRLDNLARSDQRKAHLEIVHLEQAHAGVSTTGKWHRTA